MLRIAITAQDLGRIRIMPSYGPLAETLLALGPLRRPRGPDHRSWRAAALAGLTPMDRTVVGYLRPLASIGVDLVTLAGPTTSLREGRQALLDATAEDFALETRSYRRDEDRLPSWLRYGTESRTRIADSVAGLYDRLVRPVWPHIADTTAAEASHLGSRLARTGLDDFLRGQDGLGWDGTHLEIREAAQWCSSVVEGMLGGRGIDLVPSYFAQAPEPYFPIDRTRPAVLFLPVGGDRRHPPIPRFDDIGRLLGRTRASVLLTLTRQAHSTTTLAAELGLPLSGASQHVRVLRDAGMVSTTRQAGRTAHAATALGRRLLGGDGRRG